MVNESSAGSYARSRQHGGLPAVRLSPATSVEFTAANIIIAAHGPLVDLVHSTHNVSGSWPESHRTVPVPAWPSDTLLLAFLTLTRSYERPSAHLAGLLAPPRAMLVTQPSLHAPCTDVDPILCGLVRVTLVATSLAICLA
jgi:hypothetical protein